MVVKTGSALHIPKETFNIATKKGFKVYIPPTQRRWAPTPDVRTFDPNVGGFYFVWWFYCRNGHLLPDIYYRNDYYRIPGRLTDRGFRGYLNLRKTFRKIGSTFDQTKTAKIMIAIETRM
jgi:hypothetical protein